MLKLKQKQAIPVKPEDSIEFLQVAEAPEKPEVNSWEIRSCERSIDRLERIARNIEPKKKFKLSSYELEEYGL